MGEAISGSWLYGSPHIALLMRACLSRNLQLTVPAQTSCSSTATPERLHRVSVGQRADALHLIGNGVLAG
jgi:hypothetical protein